MSGGALYHPHIAAKLIVPAIGTPAQRKAQQQTDETFQLNVRPTRVRLVSNPYNEADECEITGTQDEMGLDPRYLRSAEAYVYIGDVDISEKWDPTFNSLRFLGIARDIERSFNEHGGKMVTLKCLDYTTLFLEARSMGQDGIPPYTDTLRGAWERICDHTGYWDLDTHQTISTVQRLRDRLVFVGDLAQKYGEDGDGPIIGASVPARLAKLGKLQVKAGSDAWAVWRATCDSLGLISFIRGDRCIVTTSTDYYTSGNPPRLVYGLNVLNLRENRELGALSAKWVCARSFDPIQGKMIESLYPDPSIAPRRKKLAASANGAAAPIKAQDYETFDLPFVVSDQLTLDEIARRIWDERTRQELRGELHTREMAVPTAGLSGDEGGEFDLLQLGAGDEIRVEIEPIALDTIQSLTTMDARITALKAKGYSSDMANFIASNLEDIDKLPSEFMVHQVETTVDSTGSEGQATYNVQIQFLNRIDVSDSGAVTGQGSGDAQAPMMDQKIAPPEDPTR